MLEDTSMDQEFIALGALKKVVPIANRTVFRSPKLRVRNKPDSNSDSNSPDQPTRLSPQESEDTHSYGETKEELKQAIEGSNDVLVRATTAFTLLSDKVVLDRTKLTITRRSFFNSAEIMSIRIEDILNVTATVGPFFGHLKIMSRIPNAAPYVMGKFTRQDVLKVKRIMQGYIIALQKEIDCDSIPTAELIELLSGLGEDEHTPKKWKSIIKI